MKKLFIILSVLITVISVKAQNFSPNANPEKFYFTTLQEAVNTKIAVGNRLQVYENNEISHFITAPRSDGYLKPDSISVIAMADSITILIRQEKKLKVEWFKKAGETDFYNAFQRLAKYASAKRGVTISLNPVEYRIDTNKAGIPILKSNVITRDTIIYDTSGQALDSQIIQVTDTVFKVSTTYIPNTITDVIWYDPQDLTIEGNGARINVKGNFTRSWTYTNTAGWLHASAFNSVCPFQIYWGKNVKITDLEIDGNVDEMTLEPGVNEGPDYAMVFRGTDGITLKNLNLHHFPTDGLYIEGSGPGTDGPNGGKHYHASRNADVENVRGLFNGRQGLTLGGLNVGVFKNCDFSNTGDTTGMGKYPGHAPAKGLDIEPIYEAGGPAGTLIRADRMTSGVTFENCRFADNYGGAAALSHPYTVKNITFKDCIFDNSKYNRLYVVISNIPGLTFDGCDINTGTGAMYLTRDNGGNQRVILKNSTIVSGGSGFIAGASAQYGAIVENNLIVGKHDTSFHYFFPTISSNAIFRNNTIVIDSALYLSNTPAKGAQVYTATAEGNTWISQMDTLPGRAVYPVYYTYPYTVSKETYSAKQAISPAGGWDFVNNKQFAKGEVALGDKQVITGGVAKSIQMRWLSALPTTGKWNEGDVIWMTRPSIAGYNLYRCITSGDFSTATLPVFVPVGAISSTGAPLYHNATVIIGSDYYTGRYVDTSSTNRLAHALLPPGGIYNTASVNDTGIVAFKSALAFSVTGDMIIKGSIYVRSKNASADFTVSSRLLGNTTFTNNSLSIKGDSSLLGTKVRWLKDANNDTYLSFFDTSYIITDKTVINLESITITGIPNSFLSNATAAWQPKILKSLSGYTATTVTNTTGANWNYVINKPTTDGIAEGTTNKYYTDTRARAAIGLSFTTTGSGAATGSYNNATGQFNFNIPTVTGSNVTNIVGDQLTYQRQIAAALGSSVITESIPLDRAITTVPPTSGQLKLTAVWVPTDTVITGVRYFLGISGVYTANNYNGVALYSYSAGTATLVASSTNDGTVWAGTAGWLNKPFSAPYTATRGLYYIGVLYSASSATTAPQLAATTNSIGATIYSGDFTNGAKLVSVLNSQTTLPATVTLSSTSTTTTQHYFGLYR